MCIAWPLSRLATDSRRHRRAQDAAALAARRRQQQEQEQRQAARGDAGAGAAKAKGRRPQGGTGGGQGQTCTSGGQVSHGLEDMNTLTVNCVTYNGPDCIDLDASCSMIVKNLEDSPPLGSFSFNFSIKDGSKTLDSQIITKVATFGQEETFQADFSFQNSSGTPLDLDCKFRTLNIPTFEVCN